MSNPLFKDTSKSTEPDVDLSTMTDENAFKLMVGEEGKYKTPEALAKASFFREAHVRDLEKQIAELKAKQTEQATLAEVLAKLEKTPAIEPPKQTEKKMDENQNTTIDISKKVEELVALELSKRQGETSRTQNINKVVDTLKTNWGPGYQTILEEKAAQLGVGKDQLLELASTQPNVFLTAVGAQEKRTDNTPTFSSVLPPSKGGPVKNNKYYSDLQKKDPRAYYSAAVQRERFEMARTLGDKFFS